MAHNNIQNAEEKQTDANSVINAFVTKVGTIIQTEDEKQIENIINILKNDTDKIMLLLTPENQQNSSDLYKLIQSKKVAIKNQLKWNGVKINQHSPYMTLVLFAVMYISSRNSRNTNDYEDYVKTFNLDEAHKLSDLIETVIDMFNNSNFSTGAAALKKPTKEEIQAAKLQYNDQTKFARWYITSFGMAFDSQDLRYYMEFWNKTLKKHIDTLEKQKQPSILSNPQQTNDLLQTFGSWVSFQDSKPSKDNHSFGLARTFISKTSGSQEFAHYTLQELTKKNSRCGEKVQTVLINFWNDCVGTYNAETGKFSIDAEKFERSKNDAAKLEANKKNTNKDKPAAQLAAEPVAQPAAEPDADELKKIKTETDADLIAREKKRVDNLGKVINNLKNKENRSIDQLHSVPDGVDRLVALAKITRISLLRNNLQIVMNPLLQRTEDIDMALEQIDEAEKVLQDAQKRLDELLNSIRENQK